MKIWMALCALGLAMALGASQADAGPAITPQLRKMTEDGLKKLPVYAVMAEFYPADFRRLADTVAEGLADGGRIRDVATAARPIYLELLGRQIPKADNDNTVALIQMTRNEAAAALKVSPKACLSTLGMGPADESLPSDFLPADLQKDELEFGAVLLRQTATHPFTAVEPVSDETITQVSVKAYEAMASKASRKLFMQMGGEIAQAKSPEEQRAACEYTIALFDQLLTMPDGQGPKIYRALSAKGEAAAAKP